MAFGKKKKKEDEIDELEEKKARLAAMRGDTQPQQTEQPPPELSDETKFTMEHYNQNYAMITVGTGGTINQLLFAIYSELVKMNDKLEDMK